MNAGRIDLVVDHLVVEGLDVPPERADDLAGLVERELRRIARGGGRAQPRAVALAEAAPLADEPAGPEALARLLAERIATEAGLAP